MSEIDSNRCGLIKIIESSQPDTVYPLLKSKIALVGTGESATINLDTTERGRDLIYFIIISDTNGCSSLLSITDTTLLVNNKVTKWKSNLVHGDLIEICHKLLIYENKTTPDVYPAPSEEECGNLIFHNFSDSCNNHIKVHKNRTYTFGYGTFSLLNIFTVKEQLRPIHFQISFGPHGCAYLINNDFWNPVLINKRKMRTGDRFGETDRLNLFNEIIIEYKQNSVSKLWGSLITYTKQPQQQEKSVTEAIDIKKVDNAENENIEIIIVSDPSNEKSNNVMSFNLSWSNCFVDQSNILTSSENAHLNSEQGLNYKRKTSKNINNICRLYKATLNSSTSIQCKLHPSRSSLGNNASDSGESPSKQYDKLMDDNKEVAQKTKPE